MKESITKFDLEAAFKALDDIDMPIADKGIKANKPALTEIFSCKSKFDSLFEEYYDVGSNEELADAKEAREAEVAKAKLARIEKIVDLDAESPEDLLTSYVGKFIIQCPQCMTLFYKNPEDIEESEDDSNTVNVNEVCQHCGNETGYTLVGKVGEAVAEAPAEETAAEEADDVNLEADVSEDELEDNVTEDELDFDLGELEIDEEELEAEEPEKKEESFVPHEGTPLSEEFQDDADLDAKLEAHDDYIKYLRLMIAQEEAALEKEKNEQIKKAIQRRLDAFKDDLESALPDAVKNNEAIEEGEPEASVDDDADETSDNAQKEAYSEDSSLEVLTEELKEEAELEVTADEFEKLINSSEFQQPISDGEVRAMLHDEETEGEFNEELTEGSLSDLGKAIGQKLKQKSQGIKDKVAAAVEKMTDNVKTREEKANWVLENALADYGKAQTDTEGKLIPDEKNQKFQTFVVVCFTGKYNNGRDITKAPSFNNTDLVIAEKGVQEKDKYEDADNIAKGWSMTQGNGPAFIYLAKDASDSDAVFLCEYFKGELELDQLEKYFEVVKKHLKGTELMAKGGMTIDNATESFDTIMSGLEELQEAKLESLISDSLIESHADIAHFKLTDCSYLNEKLLINGKVLFEDGSTQETTYTFKEAFTNPEGKIVFTGLNEELGSDYCKLIGQTDKDTKTFVAESFDNL